MKARESGMPEETVWDDFFDANCIIDALLGEGCSGHVVEFGSGYGTFTIPAARRTIGVVHALDIESQMIERVNEVVLEAGVPNVKPRLCDFVAEGTGLPPRSQAHAMIYNLLHVVQPVELLREAYRVLRVGGSLSVIHWRSDVPTPRGPPLEIRPTPAQCAAWMGEAGFQDIRHVSLERCCRFHFGIVASRSG